MAVLVLLVLLGWARVADDPVCLNATAAYVDARCTQSETERQRAEFDRRFVR